MLEGRYDIVPLVFSLLKLGHYPVGPHLFSVILECRAQHNDLISSARKILPREQMEPITNSWLPFAPGVQPESGQPFLGDGLIWIATLSKGVWAQWILPVCDSSTET